jgi:N-carbamoylputrescine amidase
VVLIGSIFERRAPGLYHNTAVVIDAGCTVGVYRKMHIPEDPLYFEKFYFAPGDLGAPCFDTRFGRIGVQVCWDQWYPEGARLAGLGCAVVLFYPTAIGWHPSEKDERGAGQLDAWRTVQRGHAIANGMYVAAVNRVGVEGPAGAALDFWGHSFVADPTGRMIARAPVDQEETLLVECDPALVEQTRREWPFLRDRRVDAYPPVLNRWLDPR